MRKYINKWKNLVMLAALAVATVIPGAVSEAKTINKKVKLDNEISYVGSEEYIYGTNVKINNKSTSKYKKKIKTIKTDTDPTAFSYYTKAHFQSDEAYNQYDDYKNATSNARKYVTYSDYTMKFLKTGTYTISYVSYEKEYLEMDYTDYKYVNGTYIDYYKLVDNDGKSSSELYERKTTNGGDIYYQGITSKKIYAEGYDDSIVAASIKTGADKLQHVYCQPRNVIKTTYSRKYKVLATSKVISSVQLGKTKLSSTNKYGAYSSSSSSKRAFLTGNSGKLTVKTADKNYSITSIIVETYDKNGKAVYTKVSNKKKINYGLNNSKNAYADPYGVYSYNYSSHYKPTTVYVTYKNKFTGAFSKVNSITKDANGNTVFSITSRNVGDTKDTTYTSESIPDSYTNAYTFFKK